MLCILTSKEVLCMQFAGQNHLLLCFKQDFLTFSITNGKKEEKEQLLKLLQIKSMFFCKQIIKSKTGSIQINQQLLCHLSYQPQAGSLHRTTTGLDREPTIYM